MRYDGYDENSNHPHCALQYIYLATKRESCNFYLVTSRQTHYSRSLFILLVLSLSFSRITKSSNQQKKVRIDFKDEVVEGRGDLRKRYFKKEVLTFYFKYVGNEGFYENYNHSHCTLQYTQLATKRESCTSYLLNSRQTLVTHHAHIPLKFSFLLFFCAPFSFSKNQQNPENPRKKRTKSAIPKKKKKQNRFQGRGGLRKKFLAGGYE